MATLGSPRPTSRPCHAHVHARATFHDLLVPEVMATIAAFQHDNCPGAHRFSTWKEMRVHSHPVAPPGKVFFEVVHDTMTEWYADHSVKCLPQLFAKEPHMKQITLLDAVYRARLDVLRWFDQSRLLHGMTDLPLVAIAAWAGQGQVLELLHRADFKGCDARAKRWANDRNHRHILQYLGQRRRSCWDCERHVSISELLDDCIVELDGALEHIV